MFLVIDDEIRFWVVLPIVVIAVLASVTRNHLCELLQSKKRLSKADIQKAISNLLKNGFIIPRKSLQLRRFQLNDEKIGYLHAFIDNGDDKSMANPFKDPNVAMDMLKGSMAGMMPMILIGGIINFMFSGFVATRVPFSLNTSFRAMLQNSIEGVNLDPSWVSSVSWYLLALFGTQDVTTLLGHGGQDYAATMANVSPTGAASQTSPISSAFKAMWESLEVYDPGAALDHMDKFIIQNNII